MEVFLSGPSVPSCFRDGLCARRCLRRWREPNVLAHRRILGRVPWSFFPCWSESMSPLIVRVRSLSSGRSLPSLSTQSLYFSFFTPAPCTAVSGYGEVLPGGGTDSTSLTVTSGFTCEMVSKPTKEIVLWRCVQWLIAIYLFWLLLFCFAVTSSSNSIIPVAVSL